MTNHPITPGGSQDVSPAAVPDVTALAQTIRSFAVRVQARLYADEIATLHKTADALAALLAELERLRQERERREEFWQEHLMGVVVDRAQWRGRAERAEALAERLRQERDARTFQGHQMEGQWYSHRELLMILRALGASEPQIEGALAKERDEAQ